MNSSYVAEVLIAAGSEGTTFVEPDTVHDNVREYGPNVCVLPPFIVTIM